RKNDDFLSIFPTAACFLGHFAYNARAYLILVSLILANQSIGRPFLPFEQYSRYGGYMLTITLPHQSKWV
ncbi:hypothetical protein, partial [Serratia marcescens]|uniref:hypothetical protein n=1 Tax=Serratia marcescens TaxID=615 RepID=UPI00237FDA69